MIVCDEFLHYHIYHKIRVVDYYNFIEGATVQQYVGHDHNPHQIEPTSLVDVSIISDQSGTQANDTSRDVAAPLSPVISDPEASSPKRPAHGSEVLKTASSLQTSSATFPPRRRKFRENKSSLVLGM